ncbi:hypothetical protein DY000_02018530 [Brassica cretica]|uniref:Uncharacterized protein n=1 Tax=Brassica cretica TaxID=69181 RepID=A0ABQ7CWW1_BRACR|nr:hypothetical protein DY000_02018530 [Brassica cretica]
MVDIKTEETKAFDKRESPYFMEMSVLDSTNVENAFTQALTQIHKIVSKRRVDESNKEGERGSEMELRFRSLGFKQVEEERQRSRVKSWRRRRIREDITVRFTRHPRLSR